jgi:hypothetical protein
MEFLYEELIQLTILSDLNIGIDGYYLKINRAENGTNTSTDGFIGG